MYDIFHRLLSSLPILLKLACAIVAVIVFRSRSSRILLFIGFFFLFLFSISFKFFSFNNDYEIIYTINIIAFVLILIGFFLIPGSKKQNKNL